MRLQTHRVKGIIHIRGGHFSTIFYKMELQALPEKKTCFKQKSMLGETLLLRIHNRDLTPFINAA